MKPLMYQELRFMKIIPITFWVCLKMVPLKKVFERYNMQDCNPLDSSVAKVDQLSHSKYVKIYLTHQLSLMYPQFVHIFIV